MKQRKEKEAASRTDMSMLYTFALIAHCFMLIIFLWNDIALMAYINIVSVALYTIIVFISRKYKTVSLRSFSTIASMTEVVIHQVLAIICLGTEIGFQYFFIMAGIVIILQTEKIVSKKIKTISCFVIILITIAASFHANANQPLYVLPVYIRQLMMLPITAVAIYGIFRFCMSQWNISEHYRMQTEMLLGDRNTKIYRMQEKIIRNFADIVEKRDGNTGGHIKRTSAYVGAISSALIEKDKYTDVLTAEYTRMVVSAAPLHDIGKIVISDGILCKPVKLTESEFETMKTHSSVGGKMLEELLGDLESDEYVRLAVDISKYHHEKWDGNGYPEGKSGTDIPLSARIMAIADVFDALTSVRVYKDKISLDDAYKIMESESGKHFDPVIIEEFVRIRPLITKIYNELCEL